MKQCPTCRRTYSDDTLAFCLDDGGTLVTSPRLQETLRVSPPRAADWPNPAPVYSAPGRSAKLPILVLGTLLLIGLLAGGVGILIFGYSRISASSQVPKDEPRPNRTPDESWSGASPSPSPTPRTARALVGTWRTNVFENGQNTEITVSFLANGNTLYVFKQRGARTSDTATWQYSDATLFERFSSGATGKGSIRWIDDNNFEITIIDNGVPAYNGVKRRYHKIS